MVYGGTVEKSGAGEMVLKVEKFGVCDDLGEKVSVSDHDEARVRVAGADAGCDFKEV